MGRRCQAGFVSSAFTELMIFTVIAAVVAAIFVPKLLATREASRTHQCAVRIDALQPADATSTCPVSEMAYTHDVETGTRCCPSPERHKVEALCRAPEGTSLADAHPAPSRLRWIVTGVLGGVSGAVFGILALGMIALSIADSISRARAK